MAQKTLRGDVEELQRARELRLATDRRASMSERLARVHALCKQMSLLKGAARPR
jgi:hypothetical protein